MMNQRKATAFDRGFASASVVWAQGLLRDLPDHVTAVVVFYARIVVEDRDHAFVCVERRTVVQVGLGLFWSPVSAKAAQALANALYTFLPDGEPLDIVASRQLLNAGETSRPCVAPYLPSNSWLDQSHC
jgi:hypothetical protein